MQEQINRFRKFLSATFRSQGSLSARFRGGCVVKYREGDRPDVDTYSDPDYARFSGATNSGTFLTARTFSHDLSNEAIKTWNAVLNDPEKAAKMLDILAQEDGVEAVFNNRDILRVKKGEIDGIIYTAK